MATVHSFTQGKILSPLLQFSLPILVALLLQAMYGAADLLIVGQFNSSADVSAVATGSQVMHISCWSRRLFPRPFRLLWGRMLGLDNMPGLAVLFYAAWRLLLLLAYFWPTYRFFTAIYWHVSSRTIRLSSWPLPST